MDSSASFWRGVRRKKNLCRELRKKNLKTKIPIIREVCKRSGILMRKVEHGYQFTRNEYIINWSPSSNKVTVQYRLPGQNKTIPFLKDGQPGKPRIMVALEELIELDREEKARERSEPALHSIRAV